MGVRLSPFVAPFLATRCFKLLLLVTIVLLGGGIILIEKYHTAVQPSMQCFMNWNPQSNTDMLRPLDDVLLTDPQPLLGHNIFFLETSCNVGQQPEKKPNMLQLTARQACAIESAARHNPNFQVFVLFARPTYHHYGNRSKEQPPLIDAILSYENVQLRQLNLWRFAAGTPIEDWLKEGHLFRSSFLINHMSDLLRLLSLYRFGGIYLDLDVVVLRSMEDIPLNYAGAESVTHVANGVMSMAATGFGHEFAESCLRDFQHNFNGTDWGNNGPGLITRVAQSVCSTKNMSLMLEDRKRCRGFNVFNTDAFYAVPFANWTHFFQPQYLKKTLERAKDSYLVHVWNKRSKVLSIKVGSQTAYGKYAEQHCPKTYAAAGRFF